MSSLIVPLEIIHFTKIARAPVPWHPVSVCLPVFRLKDLPSMEVVLQRNERPDVRNREFPLFKFFYYTCYDKLIEQKSGPSYEIYNY